jgi:hypothetical protein
MNVNASSQDRLVFASALQRLLALDSNVKITPYFKSGCPNFRRE